MATFGNKLRECRTAKGFSQTELAKQIDTYHSIIGKYERDEVRPSIDVVKKLAKVLNTTVSYLLGETKNQMALKDPSMLNRINDIIGLPEEDKNHILYTIDAMLKSVKLRNIAAL